MTPKINFDFTSAVLDPRVTFTRANATATRTNNSGFVETVAADTPRFDYDSVTLACKGLLIEEARTNIIPNSNNFTGTGWSVAKIGTGALPILNAASGTSPDGTSNATKVVFDTSASGDYSILRCSISITPVPYEGSIYIKAFSANDVGKTIAFRHVSAGVPVYLSVTNSWQRISRIETGFTTGTGNYFELFTRYGFTSNGPVSVLIYGAQVAIGSFITSYIPTSGGAATRNADVATITGTAFSGLWRSGPGSILVRALPSTVSGTRPLVQVDDATADNIIALRGNTTNPELYLRAGGVDQATIDAGTISASAYRLAGAWQAGSAAASLNSGLAVNGAPASIPAVTQMRLGSDGTNYLNGHLQAVEYWPLRLSNASLQNASSTAGYQSIIHPVSRDTIITEPV